MPIQFSVPSMSDYLVLQSGLCESLEFSQYDISQEPPLVLAREREVYTTGGPISRRIWDLLSELDDEINLSDKMICDCQVRYLHAGDKFVSNRASNFSVNDIQYIAQFAKFSMEWVVFLGPSSIIDCPLDLDNSCNDTGSENMTDDETIDSVLKDCVKWEKLISISSGTLLGGAPPMGLFWRQCTTPGFYYYCRIWASDIQK